MTSASVGRPSASRPRSAPTGRRASNIPSRSVLLGAGVIILVLAALVIGQALRTYSVTLDRFQRIAENSTAKVDAVEAALQNVADMDSNAAIFVATAADNPNHWTSQQQIHDSFQAFRDQMFIVQARLDNPDQASDPETAAYRQIQYFSFDQFWQHLGNLLTAQQNADNATAVSQYIIADNYLQNQIARYLLVLEALNYSKMQDTKNGAAAAINVQVLLLGLMALALAALLTALSFWLRGRVRRVFTPGIDIALVLGWLLLILMLAELLQTPRLLNDMVDNAYYNVSATARTLAVAKLANSAQSGSVIDPTQATFWQNSFDADMRSVALRLCGQPGCLAQPFTNGGANDPINSSALTLAASISPADESSIDNVTPLVANVKYDGAAAALEQARQALNQYITLNGQLRTLIKAGSMDDAARLATGSTPGLTCDNLTGSSAKLSGDVFRQFTCALTLESTINRAVFDNTWNTEKVNLPRDQVLFGFGGYVLLIVAVALGVYHRSREL